MRIVQIGIGGWGQNHIRVLSRLGVLAAICDSDAKRAAAFGGQYSVNHYTAFDDMMRSEEFDGALVVTPTHTHAAIAEELLQAGKHVFVEKPMTYDVADGEKLSALACKKNLILTCGYIERFNPAVNIVKQAIDDSLHGKLLMLQFRRENRIPLHVKDVGIIYDTAVHDIDTANWLFGAMPTMVFARAGKVMHTHEDYASIMLEYTDQRIAIITSNWITPKRVRTFDAIFADAVMSSDFIKQDVTTHDENGARLEDNHKEEPLLLEIQNFLDAICGTRKNIVTSKDAVNVTRIANAALRSSQENVPVCLEI